MTTEQNADDEKVEFATGPAPDRCLGSDLLSPFDSFGGKLVGPSQKQRNGKAKEQQDDNQSHGPVWNCETERPASRSGGATRPRRHKRLQPYKHCVASARKRDRATFLAFRYFRGALSFQERYRSIQEHKRLGRRVARRLLSPPPSASEASICCAVFVIGPANRKFGPKAARFRVIITKAKRYKPIVSPIARCIATIATSQNLRVPRKEINNGYPVSRRQTEMLRMGNKLFHARSGSGGSELNGGRINARQMLVPSHQPDPAHFVRPPKK